MRLSILLLTVLMVTVSMFSIGCDTSADRELHRAEEAIMDAEEYAAEEHATVDFLAAEELLIEAAELAREGKIQKAREAAIKSKIRAEDATRKAKERMRILEHEMDKLGR
ncbi:MAG: hypothetical protein HQ568_03165 [Calditrichaeota bacterium]|nr:hypothetical protein [Calditrichota bacterium]